MLKRVNFSAVQAHLIAHYSGGAAATIESEYARCVIAGIQSHHWPEIGNSADCSDENLNWSVSDPLRDITSDLSMVSVHWEIPERGFTAEYVLEVQGGVLARLVD